MRTGRRRAAPATTAIIRRTTGACDPAPLIGLRGPPSWDSTHIRDGAVFQKRLTRDRAVEVVELGHVVVALDHARSSIGWEPVDGKSRG